MILTVFSALFDRSDRIKLNTRPKETEKAIYMGQKNSSVFILT